MWGHMWQAAAMWAPPLHREVPHWPLHSPLQGHGGQALCLWQNPQGAALS